MLSFELTRLWQKSLIGALDPDVYKTQRSRLREAYFKFRERASTLATQIEHDLPEYTVHDVTHLDALWELADLIAGPSFPLTPAEAFVFGGAVLIHDLGMGLASYPDGIAELKNSDLWRDVVAAILMKKLGRSPNFDEISTPDPDTVMQSKSRLLRELHAERADRLALVSWKDFTSGNEFHLIEDTELRANYGSLIGKIAHSHWLDVSDLVETFKTEIGAPGWFPNEWTVDPLKLACLLRVADAAHLDERRAPLFLRALRKPTKAAAVHWSFQSKLSQPRLHSDRLVFTSANPFSSQEAESWWLCFDILKMVDRELKGVDSMLADMGKQRLAAVGVQGVENPRRLSQYIPVSDWIPIDAQIQVTDVCSLVRSLGGENLYGRDQTIPLRELIQNGADAVRARQLIESRDRNWGEIVVSIGEDEKGHWIEVEDNGVGMDIDVLSGPFLDFGKSGWETDLIFRSFPTLASRGFESTGKYGIGFFSVFMWGEQVRVTTRRYDSALEDTLQLDFSGGLDSRPLIKKPERSDCLRDGGTRVRVWLKTNPYSPGGLLYSRDEKPLTLKELCAWLAPSLDVNLYTEISGSEKEVSVGANDWATIDGQKLLCRIYHENDVTYSANLLKLIVSRNLTEISDNSGNVIARACIIPELRYNEMKCDPGIVTVGGLRATRLSRMAGVFKGRSIIASRLEAKPIVEKNSLSDWSTAQGSFFTRCNELSETQKKECAEIIRLYGGYTASLPIAETMSGWIIDSSIDKGTYIKS